MKLLRFLNSSLIAAGIITVIWAFAFILLDHTEAISRLVDEPDFWLLNVLYFIPLTALLNWDTSISRPAS